MKSPRKPTLTAQIVCSLLTFLALVVALNLVHPGDPRNLTETGKVVELASFLPVLALPILVYIVSHRLFAASQSDRE